MRRTGETKVVSTASCPPSGVASPFTTHSSLLLSVGSTPPRSRSRKKPLCSLPPASLHTRRQALSSGTARVWNTPALPHAALWSPCWSRGSPQWQSLGPKGSGSLRRRSSSTRSCAGCHLVSFCSGKAVRCVPAQHLDYNRRGICCVRPLWLIKASSL